MLEKNIDLLWEMSFTVSNATRPNLLGHIIKAHSQEIHKQLFCLSSSLLQIITIVFIQHCYLS